MSIQKTITIDTIKQLIDINGDVTNFKADFTVSSLNGDNFFIVVSDQNSLDNGEELKYQTSQSGSLSGSIINDKNVYQNYYLVLKAERPIEVNINIDFQELPPQDLNYDPQSISENMPSIGLTGQSNPTPQREPHRRQEILNTSTVNWKIILIVSVLALGGYFLYKFYSEKNRENSGKSVDKSPGKSVDKSPDLSVKSPESNTKQPKGFTFGRVPTPSKYY